MMVATIFFHTLLLWRVKVFVEYQPSSSMTLEELFPSRHLIMWNRTLSWLTRS